MTEKTRLDVAIFERGLADSREKAKAFIMEGIVYLNGQKSDKPGTQVKPEDKIEIRGKTLKYVSRGGLKLEKAMDSFGLKLDGCVCADIGSSTGGFTDCMLQNGAAHVYAIDVGTNQLAWKLRSDERVTVMEKTNIRYVEPQHIGQPLDFCSIDVSFISLRLVLPVAHTLLSAHGSLVCLIKPQFEAGREKVGKNGVVRDSKVHEEVVNGILDFLVSNGFELRGLDYSPIKGPEGNIEYLAYAAKSDNAADRGEYDAAFVAALVAGSHDKLDA